MAEERALRITARLANGPHKLEQGDGLKLDMPTSAMPAKGWGSRLSDWATLSLQLGYSAVYALLVFAVVTGNA